MRIFVLKLPPSEVIRLLRSEIKAAHGAPELNITIRKEYQIEEEFDYAAYGVQDATDVDLVSATTKLTIEPRVESGYWVLETEVERELGPLSRKEEYGMTPSVLSLDEFEAEVKNPGSKKISVRLVTQAAADKEDFDKWLAALEARHGGNKMAKEDDAARAANRTLALSVAAIWSIGAGIYFISDSLTEKSPKHESASAESHAEVIAASEAPPPLPPRLRLRQRLRLLRLRPPRRRLRPATNFSRSRRTPSSGSRRPAITGTCAIRG